MGERHALIDDGDVNNEGESVVILDTRLFFDAVKCVDTIKAEHA